MSKSNDIRRAALDLLARREHSQRELFLKLLKKNFSDTDVQPVLETLIREGLISDTRFIENFIHYKRRRGYGPLFIKSELLARGINEDLIEHHLEISDNAWLVNIRHVWQKRFKNKLPSDFKTRAQQIRFLQYRGFTNEQINSIFQSDD